MVDQRRRHRRSALAAHKDARSTQVCANRQQHEDDLQRCGDLVLVTSQRNRDHRPSLAVAENLQKILHTLVEATVMAGASGIPTIEYLCALRWAA